jgi:diguanylate cyclase (GGDEF)-like protein
VGFRASARFGTTVHPAQVVALAAALLTLLPLRMSVSGDPGIAYFALGWGACGVNATIATAISVRVAMTAALGPAARRFWRHMSLTIVLVTLGVVNECVITLRGNPVDPPGTASLYLVVPCLASLLVLLRGLLVLPSAPRSRGEWLTFALDAGTVLVGSSLTAWHLTALSIGEGQTLTAASVPIVGLLAVGFTGVLVALKLTFAGVVEVDLGSLRLLATAALVGGLLGAVSVVSTADRPTDVTYVPVTWSLLFVIGSAFRQSRATASATTPATPAGPAGRSTVRVFALLPYLAVAVTDGLLLTNTGHDRESTILASGAVVLTGFVLVRQIVASRALTRALSRLDTTVGELRSSQSLLTFQASHDALSGLPNRTLLRGHIDDALSAAGDPGEVAVALVDLDDFKVVNDRLGHEIGDELLVGTAARLSAAMVTGDMVARLGGDEFAIVFTGLPDCPEWDGARGLRQRLERVLGALTEPLDVAGHELLVRASMGVARAAAGARPEELLRRADVAMYKAKETTGSSWSPYEDELDALATRHAEVGAGLRRGLDNDEFRLLYQPIVSLPDGRAVGAEALVRWQHPDAGPISPAEFIPIAENSGLIVPLGQWVLTEACRQAARWRADLGAQAPAYVSVNISPRQLAEERIVADVAATLADAGLPAACLMLEVTETAVFGGGPALVALDGLRALGVRIALDDFGTGHSSLGVLLSCPVDVLKLDKSFVDEITGSGREVVIATFLCDVARGLDLQTVAEGVETAAQARRLYELGYELAQGYLFARPLTVADLTALFEATPVAVAQFDGLRTTV